MGERAKEKQMKKKIWNLYRDLEQAKNAIALFTFDSEKDLLDVKLQEIFQKYYKYIHCNGLEGEDDFIYSCCLAIDSINADILNAEENEINEDFFIWLIDNLEISLCEEDAEGNVIKSENETPYVKKRDYKNLCAWLSEISLVLYLFGDSFFPPILFREQFDVFMKILDVLGIPMPELPAKTDKRGRLLLYNDLSDNIIQFAEENSLTPEETCACIYDFAFLLFEEDETEIEMPEPTNIWLTGGSKRDYEIFLENPPAGVKSIWTCNENTKRGDIIVMYVLYPYSCIQSIWRADIDGIYTPFGYYNSRTRVTNGIVVPHISLKELKADHYFSQLPITRKNFQGVNGVQFSANDYKELQRLLKEKGFDTSVLPQVYTPDLDFTEQLKNERDVEEKLLIPLLDKLGYSEKDWVRQLSQKAGRKEKAIPDFVFFPKGEIHFQNAPMIIEAKYDMSSSIERTKSYNQAFSYARMMKSKVFGICDKERLIIYTEKKGYFDRFKPVFEKHWQSINDAEIFKQLKLLIGKEAIA